MAETVRFSVAGGGVSIKLEENIPGFQKGWSMVPKYTCKGHVNTFLIK